MRRTVIALALIFAVLPTASCGGGGSRAVEARPAPLGTDSSGADIVPESLAVTPDGQLWVLSGDTIARVHPDDGKLASEPVSLSGQGRTLVHDVAAGDAGLWASATAFGTGKPAFVPIDPKAGAPRTPILARSDAGFVKSGQAAQLEVAAGRVWAWAENLGEVLVVDPATGTQTKVRTGPVLGMTAGGGYGWAITGPPVEELATEGWALERIDPRTNDVQSFALGDAPSAVAFGAGSVWVLSTRQIHRYGPDGKQSATVDLDDDGSDVAVGGNTVWVTGFGTKRVLRIDAQNNKPIGKPIPLPTEEPREMAATQDAAWITVNFKPMLRVGN